MARETERPRNWLGNTPWRPDPTPLHVVLDVTPEGADPTTPDPVRVRFASFDPNLAEEVRKDWCIAGHNVFVQTIEGGLDVVQGDY